MDQTLNLKYFYIANFLISIYHPTYSYLLMFTYTATIFKNLAPAGLIPSHITSRAGWNFTYNNVSDRATSELKASQLTPCNHLLNM